MLPEGSAGHFESSMLVLVFVVLGLKQQQFPGRQQLVSSQIDLTQPIPAGPIRAVGRTSADTSLCADLGVDCVELCHADDVHRGIRGHGLVQISSTSQDATTVP